MTINKSLILQLGMANRMTVHLHRAIAQVELEGKAAGISDEQLKTIFDEVNAKAQSSPTWGSTGERLAEIRRRIRSLVN
jgi:hypothetical protein